MENIYFLPEEINVKIKTVKSLHYKQRAIWKLLLHVTVIPDFSKIIPITCAVQTWKAVFDIDRLLQELNGESQKITELPSFSNLVSSVSFIGF